MFMKSYVPQAEKFWKYFLPLVLYSVFGLTHIAKWWMMGIKNYSGNSGLKKIGSYGRKK